jgi:dipeptidase E
MSKKRMLLLSNSTNYQKGYLEHAEGFIKDYLGDTVTKVLFVPFAGVTITWDDYTAKVAGRFKAMGYDLESIHRAADPVAAVRAAEAIAVGGGNTFYMLHKMYETGIMEVIREQVVEGIPYMGWSAGSNAACPTLKTTNDMPIAEPESFDALGLVTFQINPHYTDAQLPKHQGETRADRIAEFVEANPEMYVVGLREGSALRVEGDSMELLGEKEMVLFKKGEDIKEFKPGDSISFLLG